MSAKTRRIFLGNFDFEHRLANPAWQPTETLKRLNAELSAAWLAIARDGDIIWTPQPFDQDFLSAAAHSGLARVETICSLSDAPPDLVCVPWGWSSEIVELATKHGWAIHAPAEAAVRLANSRRTSAELEQEWNVGLPGSRSIQSVAHWNQAIQSLDTADQRWIVKAEFGMSGRERILGRGKPGPEQESWLRRRIGQNGMVFFEPWVDRIGEVGIQIEIPAVGTPQLIGTTPMLVDARGQYAGSWISFDRAEQFVGDPTLLTSAVQIALQAAAKLQLLGYFGPLGIDSMIYRDALGKSQLRPLQDLNARWTMGRLSLGWKRYLKSSETAVWLHGSNHQPFRHAGYHLCRCITTSPRMVNAISCRHRSQILVFEPSAGPDPV